MIHVILQPIYPAQYCFTTRKCIFNLISSAGDIRELSILKSAEDAQDILSIQSTPSKFTKEQMEAICGGTASPVKVVSCNDNSNQSRTPSKEKNSQWNNGNHRRTPTNKDDHLKQRRNSGSPTHHLYSF